MSTFDSRSGASALYRSSAYDRPRFGTRTTPSTYFRDPAPSYFADRYGSSGGGTYSAYNTYSDDAPGSRLTREDAERRRRQPPPPPPEPEGSPQKERRHRRGRHRASPRNGHRSGSAASSTSEAATADVSSLTSGTEGSTATSRTSSSSASSDSASSSTSSAYSFSSRSAPEPSTASGHSRRRSTPTAGRSRRRSHDHRSPSRRSDSRGRRRARGPSAADLERAAAAAAEALLRKERELRQQELALLEEKQRFAREVRERVAQRRGLDSEDAALRRVQQLVALEDPTPALHEYLRRPSEAAAALLLTDWSAATSQLLPSRAGLLAGPEPPLDATGVGPGRSRAGAYPPAPLHRSHLALPLLSAEPSPTQDAGQTPTLTTFGQSKSAAHSQAAPQPPSPAIDKKAETAASVPGSGSLPTPPPGSRRSSEGGLSRPVEVPPTASALESGGGDGVPAETVPQTGGPATAAVEGTTALVTIDLKKRVRRRVPRVRGGSYASDEGKADEASSRQGSKGKGLPTPMRRRLNVRVRRQRPSVRSVGTDMAPEAAEVPSPPKQRAPKRVAGHTPRPQRELLSPGKPQSRYVSPQPDSSPREGAAPSPQPPSSEPRHGNPTSQQPWAAAAIHWPMQAPPQRGPPAATAGGVYVPQGVQYTAATAGPMTNREFKNLLCSVYVPPEGEPRLPEGGTATAPHDSPHPTGSRRGSASAPPVGAMESPGQGSRQGYEPFTANLAGEPEPWPRRSGEAVSESAGREGVGGAGGDVVAAEGHPPASAPPPPPPPPPPGDKPLEGWDGEESVLEFPPPPQFNAPDMPGPQLPEDESGDECCGGGGCACCGCFTNMLRCMFPCCTSGRSGRDRHRLAQPVDDRRVQQESQPTGGEGNQLPQNSQQHGSAQANPTPASPITFPEPPREQQQ